MTLSIILAFAAGMLLACIADTLFAWRDTREHFRWTDDD